MEENRVRLAQERLPKFEQLERKRYDAMLRKEEKENNLRMKYGWYDQMVPDINYNLVEENAPMVSIIVINKLPFSILSKEDTKEAHLLKTTTTR